MSMFLRASSIGSALLLLIGCAGTPSQPPAAAKAAPSSAVVAANSSLAAPTDPRWIKLRQKAEENGYTLWNRSGKRYYCKETTKVGTRIPKNECLNELALEARLMDESDNRDSYARSRNCGNQGCAGMSRQGH
jgi:hypothetical protein